MNRPEGISNEVTRLIQTAMICGTVLATLFPTGTEFTVSITRPPGHSPTATVIQVPSQQQAPTQTPGQPLPPPPPAFTVPAPR